MSYRQTLNTVSQIACSVQHNITKNNGIYIPYGLIKDKPIRASIDNIDAFVDTPDGKHSFHALASAVYQEHISNTELSHHVGEPFVLSSKTHRLENIPETVLPLRSCTIIGSPKPSTAPHYENFKMYQDDDLVTEAMTNDTVWLFQRYLYRNKEMFTEPTLEPESTLVNNIKQCTPVWGAYNSKVLECFDNKKNIDDVYTMPLINAPAHEWSTLTTSLLMLHELNVAINQHTGEDNSFNPFYISLDMDLYKRVLKLPYLNEHLYGNKWIETPGQFHTVLCAIRCLGRCIEDSGLDTAWVEADIYSSVTVAQIINGKHYNRAIEAHQVTLEVLSDLYYDALFEDTPHVLTYFKDSIDKLLKDNISNAHIEIKNILHHLNFNNMVNEFDDKNKSNPNFQWYKMYMRQVSITLAFLRGIRERDLPLQLASLERLCAWFFAFNRLDYAQNIPEYIARMQNFKQNFPEIWREIERSGLTIQTNDVPFTAIGIDQAQEHVNKHHKSDGGIKGITRDSQALLRYCLSTPELIRVGKETEELLGMSKRSKNKKHHHDNEAKILRQEKYIYQLKEVLQKKNPFKTESSELINIMTNVVVPDNIKESILQTETIGEDTYKTFVEERICGQKNLWDKMTKTKVKCWNDATKSSKTTEVTNEVNNFVNFIFIF